MNWNKTSQLIDIEMHKFARSICKRLEVDSFDELEELVEIGKMHKLIINLLVIGCTKNQNKNVP